VRRGETKGVVELTFEVDTTEYTVEWRSTRPELGTTLHSTSPALSGPVSGIKDVQNEVQSILGIDEQDFINSVYIKQGAIDRLIETNDRAEMIDGLLGLDEIDEYIVRMKKPVNERAA